MTETQSTATPEADEDAEVEALVADETPLGVSQADHLEYVVGLTDDERHGLWGQPLK